MAIILASKSPRRQELLKQITNDFIIDVSDVIEKIPSNCKKQNPEAAKTLFEKNEQDAREKRAFYKEKAER